MVALRARSVPEADRSVIRSALWQRLRQQPLSFIWPSR
jgi:site-specific recombinase